MTTNESENMTDTRPCDCGNCDCTPEPLAEFAHEMDGGIAEETAAAALAYGTLGDVVGPDVLGMELGALVLSEVEP